MENWPLIQSPWPLASIILGYLYFVLKLGPEYMQDRKPFSLKRILQLYNVGQVVACVFLVYGVAVNGWTTKFSPFKCHPVEYSNDPMALGLARMAYWTFIVKLAELFETCAFVLRKKQNQVSKLHLYHHVSTLFFSWCGAKYVGGGMATFPIMVNSFIHILMYTYYLLATFGPDWQSYLAPMKPKLTMLQMIQFCILIMHSSIALRPDCPVPRFLVYMFIPNVGVIFYMFYDFFKRSYRRARKTKLI